MDSDDEDKPKEVSKTRRFAPGRALKTKPEPSSQTDAPSEFVSKKNTLMEEHQLKLQEEDVVVREIDVFFNPSIDANTELYVLQYPLRPSWRAYEMDERCQEVRVNPSTSQVEIDLSMDVHSTNYDLKFASELHMTKQTLATTWKPRPTLDYAIGVLSGDKLHLNPVRAVPQLRPSMKYLSSKRKQVEATEESARTSKKQNKEVQALKEQKPVPEVQKPVPELIFISSYLIEVKLISTHCAVGKAAETRKGDARTTSLKPILQDGLFNDFKSFE
ncbi:hypothetical protein N665_1374s0006 [Sinapis alba]|nr:hypothetical protein N665_1374s0006 [Sinapis alba]